ncbi:zinc finger transcriptional activator [Emydomyces testavorans]|uniref:Zinc finger transcriptional activator n=1 Tax=Emydomyces testavorans TaxID=2070801 RepID=A0AAF0DEV2_9EURO|nr:zinc finger transcriptional activator [Emydomyces testavorans]
MSTAPLPTKVHKRAYQACIPCRERRVRCDLGSVDHPHQGPCGRCRRERKFCHFSATRGKKKSGPTNPLSPTDPAHLIARSASFDGPLAALSGVNILPFPNHHPTDTAGSAGNRLSAVKTDHPLDHVTSTVPPPPTSSGGDKTAATLLRDAAYTSHDALNLLFEAGRHSERAGASRHEFGIPRMRASTEVGSCPSAPPSNNGSTASVALQPWSNLRFVRTGLFTAEEALDLVNYFHRYLAPFTPISSTAYQDTSMHAKLLEEEPILAVTILMLASRYMKFSGAGAVSRSYMVHERLWQHLQGMIARMIFGQEQFSGATHDNGTATETMHSQSFESALAGSSFGSLRTLGTCEALLLLSEWHPRSLHVPAGDDGDSIIVKDEVRRTRASTAGIGGRIRIDWLEPVWRSDRMCWSMLGNALALAVELGIFDEYDDTTIGARESRRDIWNNPSSSQRAYLVQHLLWVYLTQTSGRLGWKNLTNVSVTDHDASVKHGNTIRCWVGVASLMKRGNELLFPSREKTRDIIQSGEYLAYLRMLNPLLQDWQREFERAKLSKAMRLILAIEFGVALQAVVEHYNRSAKEGRSLPLSELLNPYEGNKEYFMEVVNAARAMLQAVVEELLPEDRLKHVPVRTYSRILAGAMFCLKAYALGAKDSETAVSLTLVERTAEALCTCVVDDVHLSNRFGELLKALASSLRSRVITCEQSLSGHITPTNGQIPRQPFELHGGMSSESKPIVSESFERSMPQPMALQQPMTSGEYDPRFATSLASTAPDTSVYMPMNAMPEFHHDPLMSFAGLGPNQLGWSGGQDFFDMLGPLLDVQYEQYR